MRAIRLFSVAAALALAGPVPGQTPAQGTPAYWIARMTVRDADAFARDFMPRVSAVFAAHGGQYVARGGRVVMLEGTAAPRVVILRFPSMAAAQAAYASPEYKAARMIGDRYATFESITVAEAVP